MDKILKNRSILGESYARTILKKTLVDTSFQIVNHRSEILKDKETVISIAEVILFKIYGKENITSERPYETYKIDNYWVIIGTLPQGYKGGTFLIIIDSRDCKIIRMIHGK